MKLWFKAKMFGWGWRPASLEGWVIMLVWAVANVLYFRKVDTQSHSGSDTLIGFAPFFIVTTIIFLIICYKTGEKPEWRWGKKKDN